MSRPSARVPAVDLAAPQLYFSRELAALEFNFRVLAMARDASVPLLERVRYRSEERRVGKECRTRWSADH